MNIICNTQKLKESLEYTERIITRHLTLPILNNVLLKADKSGLKIVSTNLEIGIVTWFPCKVIESGEITVPAKILYNIVSNVNSDKITLNLKRNISINISTENYKADLKGENAKDFPIIPKLKQDSFFEINSIDFCKSLNQVVGLVSNSETRPEITGVFVCKEKGSNEITLVGTDSFRLGEKVLSTSLVDKDFSFSIIVPSKTIAEVVRIFNNKEGNLKVVLEKNQISFEMDKIEVVSRLIEGNFPDYKKLIPKEFNTKVVVKREDFSKNLRLVSLFSSRVNDILLSISADKNQGMKIFASDQDLGENTSELEVNVSGNNMQIKFNWRYLIDGVTLMESQEVVLNFIDDIKPCLISQVQDKSFLYLVMPIRA